MTFFHKCPRYQSDPTHHEGPYSPISRQPRTWRNSAAVYTRPSDGASAAAADDDHHAGDARRWIASTPIRLQPIPAALAHMITSNTCSCCPCSHCPSCSARNQLNGRRAAQEEQAHRLEKPLLFFVETDLLDSHLQGQDQV